jgi:CAAX prenyl protease-like protein
MVFVVPFVVYMLVTQFEPSPPQPAAAVAAAETDAAPAVEEDPDKAPSGLLGIEYRHYPLVYTAKSALTFASMLLVLPGYRQVPFRITLLAPIVGAIGAPIWILLCNAETALLPALGLDWLGDTSARTGFNPLAELADNPAWAYGFLAIRFFGLVVVVAVMEEFFLRGFLIRFLTRNDWWNVPFGVTTAFPLVAMTLAAVISHPPSEYLAAAVWFSLVSWLMVRTKSLWDCVVAHGVTNLLLGLYVVTSGNWELM